MFLLLLTDQRYESGVRKWREEVKRGSGPCTELIYIVIAIGERANDGERTPSVPKWEAC